MLDDIFNRRSIRKYKTQAIPNEFIHSILEAAMYAPSARNEQPWHFIVCDDRKVISDLKQAHPFSISLETAPVCILVCGDINLECFPNYYLVDCSNATQNLMLAAKDLGLGTCWMGVSPVAERMQAVSDLFNLPENIKPFALVAVGYPNEEPQAPDRLKPERIHKNMW